MIVSSQGGPEAGWYADPENQHRERWWDGTTWTASVRSSSQLTTPGATGQWNGGYAPVQQTNGLAIASMVLGIAGFCGVGAILAFIFGLVALSQIKNSNGRMGGRGMAITGVVLGSIWLALVLLYVIVVIGVLAGSDSSY